MRSGLSGLLKRQLRLYRRGLNGAKLGRPNWAAPVSEERLGDLALWQSTLNVLRRLREKS